MAPKASYWIHFNREGNKAHCLIGGCKTPTVSLGKEPAPGQKPKRTGEYHVIMAPAVTVIGMFIFICLYLSSLVLSSASLKIRYNFYTSQLFRLKFFWWYSVNQLTILYGRHESWVTCHDSGVMSHDLAVTSTPVD